MILITIYFVVLLKFSILKMLVEITKQNCTDCFRSQNQVLPHICMGVAYARGWTWLLFSAVVLQPTVFPALCPPPTHFALCVSMLTSSCHHCPVPAADLCFLTCGPALSFLFRFLFLRQGLNVALLAT